MYGIANAPNLPIALVNPNPRVRLKVP